MTGEQRLWNEKVETEDRSEPLVAGFLDAIQEYLQKQETVRLNYTSHDLDFEQLSVLAWELILSDSDVADLPGHFDKFSVLLTLNGGVLVAICLFGIGAGTSAWRPRRHVF
jgi:hypothetical protein